MKRRVILIHKIKNNSFIFLLKDPKVYVETILAVHRKYNALVMTAFGNDSGFIEALDKVLYN